MDEYINDWENCDFSKIRYYESDTGYAEYYCELLDSECIEDCPLSFKYNCEKE